MAGRKSPWGNDSGTAAGDTGGGDSKPDVPPEPASEPKPGTGPRNPWQPAGGEAEPRRSASIEDIFRSRGKGGGGGGGGGGGRGDGFPGLPQRADGKSWAPLIVGGIAALWLIGSAFHQLSPKEQGIVTTFGKYSHTIESGVSMTAPWPIQQVQTRDVTSVINDVIPETEGSENLVLTSDQNLIDLSYQVRWRIKDLKLFTFAAADPQRTVKEVAEAAMRASVAEVSLNAIWDGSGRGPLELNTRERMQGILDAYRTGVQVVGVDIKKADPPEKVADAFQKVNVAQQNAQRDKNVAQAWAQQTLARSEGEAAAFDKVYQQYKLAPEVTRRRMYYDTMERVLSNNDKVVVEGSGVTSYLPLPEVKRRAPETPAAATGGQ
ncbi:protease modulator HflK [Novosphingobium sp.]|uniref:protease modulator HflK n=1 Tax=Novosphingobium sp. TaxID=1874826 RepID=UPI0027370791|nr:protease modulator HflK [Novosphingobium sp.]MDP3907779.1 protease modulator HflK [Novosphingobium sp.]